MLQTALFLLARWQSDGDAALAVLARPEWKGWGDSHPDALRLRAEALEKTGRTDEAQAERSRLAAMLRAPELDLDPALFAAN